MFITEYLESIQTSRSARTITDARYILNRLNRTLRLAEPGAATRIAAWRKELDRSLTQGLISRSKVRSDVYTLRGYLAFVTKHTGTPNPAPDLVTPPKAAWMPRPMPLGDVRKLFREVTTVEHRALLSLWYNGLRNSEALGLDLDHIDVIDGLVTVTVTGKGSKVRSVGLAPAAGLALAEHLLIRLGIEQTDEWLDMPDPAIAALTAAIQRQALASAPVFLYGGRRLTVREANRIFAAYRTKAGISNRYTPHWLRHTCATQLLEQDVDLLTIAKILGHESIAITQMYVGVSTQRKAKAMALLPSFE